VRTKIRNIFLLLVLIATTGCSVTQNIGNKVKGNLSTITDVQSTALPQVETNQPSTPEPQPEPASTEDAPASFVIAAMDTSQFDSYRSTFTLHFNGTDGNISHSQEIALSQEVDVQSQVRHIQVEMDSDETLGVQSYVDLYFFNDQIYLNNQQASGFPCLVISDQNDIIRMIKTFQPEDYFQGIKTGSLIERGERINGILTDHYSVQNAGVNLNNVHLQQGDIWIAQDGGYIVRFSGQVQADMPPSIMNGSGSASWEYNLKDINQVTGLQVPTDCLQQLQPTGDIPIPPNATEQQTLAGIITFNSPSMPDVVGEYYRQHLPQQGWKITNDTSLVEMVMMSANRKGQSLQILITPGKSGGSAVIMSTAPLE